MQADQHVVVHAPAGEHAGLLEGAHHAQSRNLIGPQTIEFRAAVDDGAGRRLDVAGDGIEGRRLAGAVRADQRQHLALPDLERHAVDGDEPAEADGEAVDRQLGGVPVHLAASAVTAGSVGLSWRRCHQSRTAGTMPSGRK